MSNDPVIRFNGITNCHTHIFSSGSVPENFIPPGLRRRLANTRYFRWLAWILTRINPFNSNDLFDRYVTYLDTLLDKQKDQLDKLITFYPPDARFIILTYNMSYIGAGDPPESFIDQCKEVLRLLIQPAYAGRILPFLFVDPRMPPAVLSDWNGSLLEFVKHYRDEGFRGIKLYPSMGYWPFDDRLDPVYRYASENGIPVLTHCSPAGIHIRKPLYRLPGNHPITNENLRWIQHFKRFDNYGHPDNFRIVLAKYPNLKLCLGHFGGYEEMKICMKARTEMKKNSTWFMKAVGLIRDFDNVYADISYMDRKFSTIHLINDLMKVEKYRERILFGTDFPVDMGMATENKFILSYWETLGSKNFRQIAIINPNNFL
jgi:predicted TIM-barrel fold metal-dependent hydrolase